MSVDNPTCAYILVVLTDKYAGNFEREMCAYMTGQIGECGVGNGEAEEFFEAMELIDKDPDMFEDYIAQEPDDHETCRPCSIWNFDKKRNDYHDVAIFLDELPDSDMLVLLRDRAHQYGKENGIEIKGLQMIKSKTTVVETIVKVKELSWDVM